MDLSADQLASIAQTLSAGAPGPEQRRAPRVSHRRLVPIILSHNTPQERQLMVMVRDLSARGVGLDSSRPLPRGEQFVLQINGDGNIPTVLLCTVAHCRKQKKGFAIGAEFTCMLSEAPPAKPSDDELARIRASVLS